MKLWCIAYNRQRVGLWKQYRKIFLQRIPTSCGLMGQQIVLTCDFEISISRFSDSKCDVSSRLAFFRVTLWTIRTIRMLRMDHTVLDFVFLSLALSCGLMDCQLYLKTLCARLNKGELPESRDCFLIWVDCTSPPDFIFIGWFSFLSNFIKLGDFSRSASKFVWYCVQFPSSSNPMEAYQSRKTSNRILLGDLSTFSLCQSLFRSGLEEIPARSWFWLLRPHHATGVVIHEVPVFGDTHEAKNYL